ncbi:MAG: redox-regulated ATPase YchF [Desulfobacterales bacterium]|nr:redox-regulated ATPase YchF [Desulfobacterales bacterium]
MKLGIIGLSGSGKTTVFEALTQQFMDIGNKTESRIGTIRVPDTRVDVLSDMFRPRKTIYAQVEYFLPGKSQQPNKDKKLEQTQWNSVRDCDALIHVVRNFESYGMDAPQPATAIRTLNQELILNDLVSVEKRLERLELDKKRGKVIDLEEQHLLIICKEMLENEKSLRQNAEIVNARVLRGFAFLSAKPMLILFNNTDDNVDLPKTEELFTQDNALVIRGKLEQELAQMNPEETEAFLKEFQIDASATDRVIKASYSLIDLISFFTVGEDEVRAWTIKNHTSAYDAAEVIHSDIKKGFIRAEVISYADLMAVGSYAEARKKGSIRLEGKTYIVQDGDIVHFRFNV